MNTADIINIVEHSDVDSVVINSDNDAYQMVFVPMRQVCQNAPICGGE